MAFQKQEIWVLSTSSWAYFLTCFVNLEIETTLSPSKNLIRKPPKKIDSNIPIDSPSRKKIISGLNHFGIF